MAGPTIGVIGAGAIGRAHVDTILRSGICGLAGIADPTEAGHGFARERDAPWFADHRELLAKARPDAAIVATPNDTHRAIAQDCIAAGVAVLVEKPVASTVEDGEAIAAASRDAGLPVLVGHHRRHNPIIKRARSILADGAIGRLATVSILATFFKPPEYFDLAWRRSAGGGPVLINLIHEIDLVRHLCGEIVAVQALTSHAGRGFAVEDTAAVLLQLDNGALATVSLSDTAATPWNWDLASGESPNYPAQPAPVATHFLAGTDGGLALPTLELWRYEGLKSWFAPIARSPAPVERGDPYAEQLRHLCAVVRGDETPLVTAADATRTLRATLAVHEAARTGRTIDLASH